MLPLAEAASISFTRRYFAYFISHIMPIISTARRRFRATRASFDAAYSALRDAGSDD